MTEEDLQQIRTTWEHHAATEWREVYHEMAMRWMVPQLLAEVERLRAENADLLVKNANMAEGLLSASKELLEDIGPRFAKQTADNAAMREIVQEVVDNSHYNQKTITDFCNCSPERLSGDVSPYWRHQPDCLITKARAILEK